MTIDIEYINISQYINKFEIFIKNLNNQTSKIAKKNVEFINIIIGSLCGLLK